MKFTLERMERDRQVDNRIEMKKSLFIKLLLLVAILGFYIGSHMP